LDWLGLRGCADVGDDVSLTSWLLDMAKTPLMHVNCRAMSNGKNIIWDINECKENKLAGAMQSR
jgi:hypothetical protein